MDSPLGAELPLKSQQKSGRGEEQTESRTVPQKAAIGDTDGSLTSLQKKYQPGLRYLAAPQLSRNNDELQTSASSSWALNLVYFLGFKAHEVSLRNPNSQKIYMSKNFWGSEPECFKWFPKEHLRLGAVFNTSTQSMLGHLSHMTKTKMHLQQVSSCSHLRLQKNPYF